MPRQTYRINVPPGNKDTPQSTFDIAIAFHEAALRCQERVPDGEGRATSPTAPLITCYAFASELYLKSLLLVETGKAMRGHRINVLFAQLKPETRTELTRDLIVTANLPSEGLPEILSQLSNAFVEWRYIYELERGRHIDVRALVGLTKCLHRLLRRRKPEWEINRNLAEKIEADDVFATTFVMNMGGGRNVRGSGNEHAKATPGVKPGVKSEPT